MTNPFRKLLVSVDLSPVSDRLLRCAANLPLADDATVTLLHVVSRDLNTGDQHTALNDAAVALARMAGQLKTKLKGINIRCVPIVENPATGIARFAKSSRAELIVMGRCRTIRGEAFLGSTAERVVRRGQLPVLIVRRGTGRYRRPAIAIDADAEGRVAIRFLLRTLREPRPAVRVIHVVESAYRGMYYRSLTTAQASLYEGHDAAEESSRLDKLISSTLAQAGMAQTVADKWKYILPSGMPRIAIPRAVERIEADLLVLGTRGRSGLAFAYLGSVAGDLLRNVECDVLVVPRRAGLKKRSDD